MSELKWLPLRELLENWGYSQMGKMQNVVLEVVAKLITRNFSMNLYYKMF